MVVHKSTVIVFSVLALAIGILLLWTASNIYNSNCDSTSLLLHDSIMTLIIMSTIMVMSSIYMILYVTNCICVDVSGITPNILAILCGILGIVLVVLGGILNSEANSNKCNTVTGISAIPWITGLCLIVLALLYYKYQ